MLNLYCKQTNTSLWRVRRNKDILYYTILIHSLTQSIDINQSIKLNEHVSDIASWGGPPLSTQLNFKNSVIKNLKSYMESNQKICYELQRLLFQSSHQHTKPPREITINKHNWVIYLFYIEWRYFSCCHSSSLWYWFFPRLKITIPSGGWTISGTENPLPCLFSLFFS